LIDNKTLNYVHRANHAQTIGRLFFLTLVSLKFCSSFLICSCLWFSLCF